MSPKTVFFLLVIMFSQTSSEPFGGRMWNHFYFQSVKNNTSTTSSPTVTTAVADKLPGPSVKFPSSRETFLSYLLNRQPALQPKQPDDKTIAGPTQGPAESEHDPTPAGDKVTETTTAATAATTTVETTTKYNNYFFNEDGLPNRNRPGMLTFSGSTQEQVRDREGQAAAWLLSVRRMPLLATSNNKSRPADAGRTDVPDGETTEDTTPTVEVSSSSSTSAKPQSNSNRDFGVVEIGPSGGVYIVNNGPTTSSTTRDQVDEKGGPGHVDVQDKPFYGNSHEWYFTDPENTQKVPETSTSNQVSGGWYNNRHKRAAANDESGKNGNSRNEALKFEKCQRISRSLQKVNGSCKERDTFLGFQVVRFCERAMETANSAQSDLLKTYINNAMQNVSDELERLITEATSCDEVTVTLAEALLEKNRSSCLFQKGLLCNITEDAAARPELARMLNKPTTDVDFMMRLLINIGNLTYYCKGGGSSIFVFDLMVLASTKDSPFKSKFSNPPVPGVVPKF